MPFKAKFERIERRGIYEEDEMLDLEHVSGDAEKAVTGILPGSGHFKGATKIRECKYFVNVNLEAVRSHPRVQGYN